MPKDSLAAVGPLLCLFPAAKRSELGALAGACAVCAECCIDDDGIRESVRFLDQEGRTCLRLFLLPDSDYTGWERLREGMPCIAHEARLSTCSRCVDLMRCLGRRWRGQDWMASLLRIDSGCPARPGPRIASARVSAIGREIACRIARAEGAPIPA
ncbi:Hemin transport protein [Lysobacter pythonis]|uniref:Hemin transport protein n=1 Tax=Solilutibacter pythonis TaxID=2483112 RepID=A0A3M2HPW1_9GAMM|nr:Hemin transport protein [Lysobacter pythonis]